MRSTGFFENTTLAEMQNKKGVQLFNIKGGKCGIVAAMFRSITVVNVKLKCKVPEYNAFSTTFYDINMSLWYVIEMKDMPIP